MKKLTVCLLLIVLTAAISLVANNPSLAKTPIKEGLSGRVTDLVTNKPIIGARIRLGCYKDSFLSNDRGIFQIPAFPGTYEIFTEAKNYRRMSETMKTVSKNKLTHVDIAMVPEKPTARETEVIDTKLVKQHSLQPREPLPETDKGFADTTQVAVPSTIRVLMPSGAIVTMDMDEYLKGVVPCEMGSGSPIEALKAQAIAARCFGSTTHKHGAADVCTTTDCQVWRSTHYGDTDQAVAATHNIVATYGGGIITAYYFGHCDGHTRNSEDVWGGYLPYCRSVSCSCGYTWLYGHGVGMCQRGAQAMGGQGRNYSEILKHYYTGIDLPAPSLDAIRLYQGIWIRGGPYFQGSFFDAQYTLKNYTTKAMTILPAIGGRGPNNETWDLGDTGWKTIGPGNTYNIYKKCWLKAQGRFMVFATYKDQSGNWHYIGPGEGNTAFSATVNVEPITNYVKISHGIWVHLYDVGKGEYFDAQFGTKNYAPNNAVSFEPYILVRGPDNSGQDLGGSGSVVLNPGQTITCSKTKNNFGTVLGNYTIGACAYVSFGPSWSQWHSLTSGTTGTAPSTVVKVSTPNRHSRITKNNFPYSLKRSQTMTIKVTVKNTSSNVSWVRANGYELTVRGNFGYKYILLPNNSIVPPGRECTFAFSIKAPSKAGNYRIAVQMRKKNVSSFGSVAERLIRVR